MRVLLIEDNPDHATLIEYALRRIENVTLLQEELLQAGLARLQQDTFDVCLCDLQLPDSPISDTVSTLKNLQSDTPIIILTSLNSVDTAEELLQDGLQNFLSKEELSSAKLQQLCNDVLQKKQQEIASNK